MGALKRGEAGTPLRAINKFMFLQHACQELLKNRETLLTQYYDYRFSATHCSTQNQKIVHEKVCNFCIEYFFFFLFLMNFNYSSNPFVEVRNTRSNSVFAEKIVVD